MDYTLKAKNQKIGYYCNTFNAYIIDYYEDSSFPLFGWIKPCFNCSKITTSSIDYDYENKKIIIPLCNKCNNINKFLKYSILDNKLNNFEFNNDIGENKYHKIKLKNKINNKIYDKNDLKLKKRKKKRKRKSCWSCFSPLKI